MHGVIAAAGLSTATEATAASLRACAAVVFAPLALAASISACTFRADSLNLAIDSRALSQRIALPAFGSTTRYTRKSVKIFP